MWYTCDRQSMPETQLDETKRDETRRNETIRDDTRRNRQKHRKKFWDREIVNLWNREIINSFTVVCLRTQSIGVFAAAVEESLLA